MKLSVVSPEKSGEMIPLISRYANSQNKVSDADFFSNHEYHRRVEQISRRLWTTFTAQARSHQTLGGLGSLGGLRRLEYLVSLPNLVALVRTCAYLRLSRWGDTRRPGQAMRVTTP